MKIALNTRVLLKHRMEGVSRYIYETSKRMVLAHPEDEFYFFFDRPYDESFIFADNVTPVIIAPQARHPLLWKIWFDYSVPYYLNKYNIDVFLSGDTYLSLKTTVPTILISHDIAYHHFPDHIRSSHLKYYKKYFPAFHHRADHIVAVSEYTKNDIIRAYSIDPAKVSVGYNSTPDGYAPLDLKEQQTIRQKLTGGSPYFIYVGSLHPRKNVVNLILAFDAFKNQNQSDHKLVLVGRMAWKNEELNKISNSLDYKNSIIFLGHLPNGVLPKYVGASEALTYVSLFEGFGIPILEAMSAGTPVITSNVSSMPEVAKDAALLVDPRDVNSIAAAMKKISENNTLKNELITKGFLRKDEFSWDKTANHIYKCILNLYNK